MSSPQQALYFSNLAEASRHLSLDVRVYFGVAAVGCGFGAHLWPVFTTHPIW
jgi:hypothetical protein